VARQQALASLLHKRRKAGGPAGICRIGGLQHQLVLIYTRKCGGNRDQSVTSKHAARPSAAMVSAPEMI